MDFSVLWDRIFPFVGQIFGIFSYLGTVSYSQFLDAISSYWVSGTLFEFTNVITGTLEVFQTTGVSTVLLAPFILIAQGTTTLFGGILSLLNIPWDAPLWFVASSYLLIFTTIFGLAKGVVSQFAFKA